MLKPAKVETTMTKNPDFQKSRFSDQENQYISTRAMNSMHQAQLKNLEKRILSLEEDKKYLTLAMSRDLRDIKAELKKFQCIVDDQGKKLMGMKGVFARLRNFFGI